MNPKFRDFLAIPFMFLGLACDYIAASIGGKWTAQQMIKAIGRGHRIISGEIKPAARKDPEGPVKIEG